ncbi:hypothetical protein GCM10010430_56250 [Kitasatospora cystarginea]|uniref:Condensation domain-containing protein n=1 Tax=Kitasatospora cystarginea TaxID=58350 RepID=A0ABN3ENV2_9ACTN
MRQHDALRIGILDESGRDPLQWVRDEPDVKTLVDCRQVKSSSEEQFSRYVAMVLGKDLSDPWDLAVGYPFRFRILRYSPTVHAFLASFSHVALDGRGVALVLRSLWRNYEHQAAGAPGWPEPTPDSFVLAAGRHGGSEAPGRAEAAEFWSKRLAGRAPVEVPREDFQERSEPGECVVANAVVRGAERTALRSLSRLSGCTEFQLAVSAIADAAFAVTSADRVDVWMPMDARTPSEEKTSGMFTVSLPISVERGKDPRQVVRQVRREVMAVAAYRNVDSATLTEIQERITPGGKTPGPKLVVSYFNRDLSPGEKTYESFTARPGSYSADYRYISSGMELKIIGGVNSLNLTLVLGPQFSAPAVVQRVMSAFSSRLGGISISY